MPCPSCLLCTTGIGQLLYCCRTSKRPIRYYIATVATELDPHTTGKGQRDDICHTAGIHRFHRTQELSFSTEGSFKN